MDILEALQIVEDAVWERECEAMREVQAKQKSRVPWGLMQISIKELARYTEARHVLEDMIAHEKEDAGLPI